ncbi:hypothetical protein A1Q2_05537 [Trichosporon asahii var. asahii CBS 8904]|uniref:Uncharacterized protein n=1 Tax=Trichosporon asahii var. asahii (strain CBS 8904) TaxID=1220162 RepID=K1WF72_TRIAC|nr:hypothetical protein A1Q2_05537 [Trichosporon asahii var. asahii CBS 8904]
MATSANALYVVRLVLGARNPAAPRAALASAVARRNVSTAAIGQQADAPTATGAATDAAAVTDVDFLEPETGEYNDAADFLPERTSTAPAPIPWPTIFPHGEARPVQRRPCDLLARLVSENRIEQARKVYDELHALHTVPVHRKLYLKAALSSLQPTAEGRADFLFWLELYSNRGAAENHPGLKATWDPIVSQILYEHLDVDFIGKFLELGGRKGLLPALMPHFTHVLATMAAPSVSEEIMQRSLAAYINSTTSKTSTSRRAEYGRAFVSDQVNHWWNQYLRSLSLAGWNDAARALLFSPPPGVAWDLFTRHIVVGDPGPRKQRALERRRSKAKQDPLDTLLRAPDTHEEPLAKMISSAVHAPTFPDVGTLARIQAELGSMPNRARLLESFKRRFINPPKSHPGRSTPTVAQQWWWHAEITRLVRAEKHKEAVDHFREHFLWLGLPPVHLAPLKPDATRLVPSISILTTIIPSVLSLLPKDEWVNYHSAYLDLASTMAPSLHPTEYTHLAFVREIAFHLGPPGAQHALKTTMQRGIDPGLPAWNAHLLALAGRGRFDAAQHVLKAMESGRKIAGRALPSPTARTYIGLVRVCAANGQEEWARKFLEQLAEFQKEDSLEDVPEPKTQRRRPKTVHVQVAQPVATPPSSSQSS